MRKSALAVRRRTPAMTYHFGSMAFAQLCRDPFAVMLLARGWRHKRGVSAMKAMAVTRILGSPEISAAVARDSFTSRVAEIAVALDCALGEATNADAERQLHKLVWLLCSRSGGGVCQAEGYSDSECRKTHYCTCAKAGNGGLAN
jgi:hypothetical protein